MATSAERTMVRKWIIEPHKLDGAGWKNTLRPNDYVVIWGCSYASQHSITEEKKIVMGINICIHLVKITYTFVL